MTTVRCPICLRLIDWSAAEEVVMTPAGTYERLERRPDEDDIQWNHRRLNVYRMCPGSAGSSQHALPGRYGDFGEPLVIGMVGESASGKTHLLAAMIGMFCDAARMARIGLSVGALDLALHDQYMREQVRPFLDNGQGLLGTRPAPPEFTDAFWVHNRSTGKETALAFFDVSGEWLASHESETPFLGAVNGLIFVVDPARIRHLGGTGGSVTGDPSFGIVLDKLARIRGFEGSAFVPVPAVVVIGKCDLLRHTEHLVGRWFTPGGRDDLEEFDLSTVEEESEDAYAFLWTVDAAGWLAPFVRCADATLHFATATGTKAVREGESETFPLELLKPRRALKPLLSLLAMSGVLERDKLRPAGRRWER
ncbi:hypothetical protein ACFVHB_00370 [Kitasatospora sp. NPDC127111]|uniref:hypothetical protein n=1 Tax=Kitasatospora sp. NPDC127111 TaxID=3345363 RepID=UPI00363FFAD3